VLGFHPRGLALASGSKDGSVLMWSLGRIRRELASLGLSF
jgi:hypothetical protein